ncbi:hypothetical protein N184_36515 [Sinorhizobium sp. GL28]|jgi:hypothetical protein|nr:hypothetical protein N184_36515 [Sinorhizobium sp. GL28]
MPVEAEQSMTKVSNWRARKSVRKKAVMSSSQRRAKSLLPAKPAKKE